MKKLTSVAIFTLDFDKAIEFYSKWLDFLVVYEWNKSGKDGFVKMMNVSYGLEIILNKPQTKWDRKIIGRQSGSSSLLSFRVENLTRHYEQLLLKGAPFTRELASPTFGDFAYLSDPDGNEILLVEYHDERE